MMTQPVLRCATCQTTVGTDAVWPWRCPRSSESDRAHVLLRVPCVAPLRPRDDPNPFVAFDSAFVWSVLAEARGMDRDGRAALVRSLDRSVAAIDGAGFCVTPFGRSDALSDALGFSRDGGVWVKDETGSVAGSHKARHLVTILLHLLACERLGVSPAPTRPGLAISSCGNAALAAATLAAAADWPLSVFVPPRGNPWVLERLRVLGADVVLCPRLDGDRAGDPCLHRFREAVASGSIPFSVQGPENSLCLDGGRTIGWEIAEAMGARVDRVFVQVGGGALATSIALAFADEEIHPRLHAVQAQGCAPLARAWECAQTVGLDQAPSHWNDCMWPWEQEPVSAADGILDDESYDWLGVVQGMASSRGSPIVATEGQIIEANALASATTSTPVDHTGTAGLAGLLAIRASIADDERVVVLFTGRRRGGVR